MDLLPYPALKEFAWIPMDFFICSEFQTRCPAFFIRVASRKEQLEMVNSSFQLLGFLAGFQ